MVADEREAPTASSAASARAAGQWVLLSYRMPRNPSTARITVWRKLKRLGVAQLGDGVVTLPADARTREQLDWIAEEIVEGGGEAMVWLARPTTAAQERRLARTMAQARTAEYTAVIAEADQALTLPEEERRRALRRLRGELRRIQRRDFFPPPARTAAQRAVQSLHSDHVTEESA
ncbi:Chromate resistance protein ChrB [Nocardia carnea]|uniref:Chromate resistance protein ChrB n=1 Tax=Nocardia carnea TaxID=37328 RepID=UPI002455277F|nr:Chromate resistance protein ChrB [Nocardia carnea]